MKLVKLYAGKPQPAEAWWSLHTILDAIIYVNAGATEGHTAACMVLSSRQRAIANEENQ
jgi:hypothetical protein